MNIKTASELLEEILEYFKQEFDLDYIPEGSVLYNIQQAMAIELARTHRDLQELATNTYFSTTGGIYLDAIAKSFGVQRSEERTPNFVGGIEIYTIDGNPLIDKGLTVEWLQQNTLTASDTSGNTLELIIDDNVFGQILDNFEDWKLGDNPIYFYTDSILVYAKPQTVVSDVIPKGSLDTLAPSLEGIQVRNITDIILVYPPETDTELRYKIFAKINESSPNSLSKVSAILDTLPYVASYEIKPFARGIGTADIIIIPSDLTAIEGQVASAYHDLKPYLPETTDVRIVAPNLVYFSINGTVYYENTLENELIEAIKETLKDYFASLPLGSRVTAERVKNLLQSKENITNITNLSFRLELKMPDIAESYNLGVFTEYQCKELEKPMLNPDETKALNLKLRGV